MAAWRDALSSSDDDEGFGLCRQRCTEAARPATDLTCSAAAMAARTTSGEWRGWRRRQAAAAVKHDRGPAPAGAALSCIAADGCAKCVVFISRPSRRCGGDEFGLECVGSNWQLKSQQMNNMQCGVLDVEACCDRRLHRSTSLAAAGRHLHPRPRSALPPPPRVDRQPRQDRNDVRLLPAGSQPLTWVRAGLGGPQWYRPSILSSGNAPSISLACQLVELAKA